jgi:hypothetical protein
MIGAVAYRIGPFWKSEKSAPKDVQPLEAPVPQKPTLDYNQMPEDKSLQTLMQERKSQYGVDKGIDLMVTPDEAIKIGETTVGMQDIIDKINIQDGQIVEKNIDSDQPLPSKKSEIYGIYVVQPNDNIWNIHFRFLKSYFANRGIALSPIADEPNNQGYSSGVGKLLKFSEKMVYIYNLKDKSLALELHTIEPLSKIVIYKMKEVYAILDAIDYSNIQRIQFDGETIWIPAEQ